MASYRGLSNATAFMNDGFKTDQIAKEVRIAINQPGYGRYLADYTRALLAAPVSIDSCAGPWIYR